ncbi:hypothetical protein BJ165DRAFT_1532199 [Panaeolus papilionaceus]|nr:hypothetical protein BJ165DRAFT_1532199 [Panaeolus papilionaceus]
MTSPYFFLLDYLVTPTLSAQTFIESSRTKILPTTSLKSTNSEDIAVFNRQRLDKIKKTIRSMLYKLRPGNCDDCQFVEKHYAGAILYMSSLLPPPPLSLPPSPSPSRSPSSPPQRPPLPRPVIVELPTRPTLRSLCWAAETTLNALNLPGLSGALFGDMNNAVWCSIQANVMVYGSTSHRRTRLGQFQWCHIGIYQAYTFPAVVLQSRQPNP